MNSFFILCLYKKTKEYMSTCNKNEKYTAFAGGYE